MKKRQQASQDSHQQVDSSYVNEQPLDLDPFVGTQPSHT